MNNEKQMYLLALVAVGINLCGDIEAGCDDHLESHCLQYLMDMGRPLNGDIVAGKTEAEWAEIFAPLVKEYCGMVRVAYTLGPNMGTMLIEEYFRPIVESMPDSADLSQFNDPATLDSSSLN